MATELLKVNNIDLVYSSIINILKGVTIIINEGQIITLIGNNGAGKTSTLRAISGLLRADGGRIIKGSIVFEGLFIHNLPPEKIAKLGIIQVLEGRGPFKHLTVEENLKVGTATRKKFSYKTELEKIYHYFPQLRERNKIMAGYLSGGELQMLAIGRALMAIPRLLLLDEPSLGLAPMLVNEIFNIIHKINQDQNTAIILVEQNSKLALDISDYGYVMENGKIVMEGFSNKLKENGSIKEFYLGKIGKDSSKTYNNLKSNS